jgi:ERCC4-type nuclease
MSTGATKKLSAGVTARNAARKQARDTEAVKNPSETPAADLSREESPRAHIVADARERHVLRHQVLQATTTTIAIGDYLVKYGDRILAVIERKSLEDYAASLKDGRSENKHKLIELRRRTGCRIIYLIEGHGKPGEYYGNIAWVNIESSIFHLILRENICVVWTRDSLDTAETLNRLTASAGTLCGRLNGEFDELDEYRVGGAPADLAKKHAGDPVAGGAENAPVATGAATETPADDVESPAEQTIDELVMTQPAKTTAYQVRTMWAVLPGITTESASDYMKRWSLTELIAGIPNEDVVNHKLSTGKSPNSRVRTSLYGPGVSQYNYRMLCKVYGISPATARTLLGRQNLPDLLKMTVEELADVVVVNKRLGPSKAGKILECFNYRM